MFWGGRHQCCGTGSSAFKVRGRSAFLNLTFARHGGCPRTETSRFPTPTLRIQQLRPSKHHTVDRQNHQVYIHFMGTDCTITGSAKIVLDTCMCHKARMAARAITRAYDDALRSTGLRATQVLVLAAVGARGALSIKSLADSLGMERTTLTRNLL